MLQNPYAKGISIPNPVRIHFKILFAKTINFIGSDVLNRRLNIFNFIESTIGC